MSQGARPAMQERSKKTRDNLVAALEALLRERDFDEISVADIAAHAGVTPGAIYRRFKNKEAFIPVLFELYRARLEEWAASEEARLEVEPGQALRDILRAAARVAWRQMAEQAHLMRPVYLYSRVRPDLIGEGWEEWEAVSLNSFRSIIALCRDEVAREDPDRSAALVAQHFGAALIDRALFPAVTPDWGLDMDGETFAEQMADFAYGYLTTPDA